MPYCLETISATSKISMESRPQTLAIQRGVRIDILRLDLEIQGLHEQRGKFPLETDIGQRRRLCMSDALSDIDLGFRLEF